MRLKLIVLTLIASAGLCFHSNAVAGGCPSCPNGSCAIQAPVEVLVAPPSIARKPKTPATAKTCPACSHSTARRPLPTLLRGARRGIGRLLLRRCRGCR